MYTIQRRKGLSYAYNSHVPLCYVRFHEISFKSGKHALELWCENDDGTPHDVKTSAGSITNKHILVFRTHSEKQEWTSTLEESVRNAPLSVSSPLPSPPSSPLLDKLLSKTDSKDEVDDGERSNGRTALQEDVEYLVDDILDRASCNPIVVGTLREILDKFSLLPFEGDVANASWSIVLAFVQQVQRRAQMNAPSDMAWIGELTEKMNTLFHAKNEKPKTKTRSGTIFESSSIRKSKAKSDVNLAKSSTIPESPEPAATTASTPTSPSSEPKNVASLGRKKGMKSFLGWFPRDKSSESKQSKQMDTIEEPEDPDPDVRSPTTSPRSANINMTMPAKSGKGRSTFFSVFSKKTEEPASTPSPSLRRPTLAVPFTPAFPKAGTTNVEATAATEPTPEESPSDTKDQPEPSPLPSPSINKSPSSEGNLPRPPGTSKSPAILSHLHQKLDEAGLKKSPSGSSVSDTEPRPEPQTPPTNTTPPSSAPTPAPPSNTSPTITTTDPSGHAKLVSPANRRLTRPLSVMSLDRKRDERILTLLETGDHTVNSLKVALENAQEDKLPLGLLTELHKMLPTRRDTDIATRQFEEMKDMSLLPLLSRFALEVGTIPNIRARVECLMFRQEYEIKNMLVLKEIQQRLDLYMEVLDSQKLKALVRACGEWMRSDRKLSEDELPPLEYMNRYILDAPNTASTEIMASLCKTNPVALRFREELPSLQHINLSGTPVSIESLFEDIRFGMDFLSEEADKGRIDDPFRRVMKKFVEQEALEVQQLVKRMKDYRLLTDAVLDYLLDQGWGLESAVADDIPVIIKKMASKFEFTGKLPEPEARPAGRAGRPGKARARTVVDR
eukprot:TRINITY_DN3698_c0_g1_i2.p1 TRINITY_DN3698_c0_g1~~TRINITY_DN3698_c0_g1_i2.p1  ORF type:complete len:926 (+),score=237.36 TRINITY_DN3698_c0_g1_i2:254-2779(+)